MSDSVDQISALQGLPAGTPSRIDGHDPGAILAATGRGARTSDRPEPDRLQDVDRLRRAEARGHPQGAWRSARRRGDRRNARRAGLALRAVRHSRRHPGRLARSRRRAARSRARRWQARLDAPPAEQRAEFERRHGAATCPPALNEAIAPEKRKLADADAAVATRKASEAALKAHRAGRAGTDHRLGRPDRLQQHQGRGDARRSRPAITPAAMSIGAFANTAWPRPSTAWPCMAAIIASGATFLAFADYCRPALRLGGADGHRASIQVFTHDSIGLGEDGPTHQPVEHLASLRAIPNLLVFRPADATETLECWQAAIEARKTPSVLALTRQNLAAVAPYLCRRKSFRPRRL